MAHEAAHQGAGEDFCYSAVVHSPGCPGPPHTPVPPASAVSKLFWTPTKLEVAPSITSPALKCVPRRRCVHRGAMGTLQRPSRDPLPTVPVVGSLLRPDALGDKRHSGRGSATFWNTFSIVPRVCVYAYVWHDNDDGVVLPSGWQRLRGCFSGQSTLTRLYGGGTMFPASARTYVDTSRRCYSGLLSDRERRTRSRAEGDPVELRVHGFFPLLVSIFSCCTSVGTTGCHPGAIEISGRVACSSDGRLSFDKREGTGVCVTTQARLVGFWRVGAREAWRLGVCSLEVDMDVVQFDVLRCTHRILETILKTPSLPSHI